MSYKTNLLLCILTAISLSAPAVTVAAGGACKTLRIKDSAPTIQELSIRETGAATLACQRAFSKGSQVISRDVKTTYFNVAANFACVRIALNEDGQGLPGDVELCAKKTSFEGTVRCCRSEQQFDVVTHAIKNAK